MFQTTRQEALDELERISERIWGWTKKGSYTREQRLIKRARELINQLPEPFEICHIEYPDKVNAIEIIRTTYCGCMSVEVYRDRYNLYFSFNCRSATADVKTISEVVDWWRLFTTIDEGLKSNDISN